MVEPEVDAPAAAEASDAQAANGATVTATEGAAADRVRIPDRSIDLPKRDPRRYETVREHGRGGLGRVLEAFDTELDRTVAVKELLERSNQAEERFVREAKITASLQHPGIVPLYEAGRWPSGKPYYAMKMVSGRSLKELIAEKTTLDERLSLLPNVLAVADAIAYAHSRGVIHRDLKPANVMVGEFGETIVIDWGLAKDLRDSSDGEADGPPYRVAADMALTVTGDVVGTPAYMPPEQACGKSVDERADVYSLGAILYHVVSGALPYDASSSQEVLNRLLHQPAVSLHERQPDTPDDLAAIVSKAMAREPDRRYASAHDFSDDLRRFQTGKLVTAYDYSLVAIVRRVISKHRALVAVVAIAASAFAVFGVASLRRIVRERDRAEQERSRATSSRDEMVLAQARASLQTDPTTAIAWLKRYPLRTESEVRVWNIALDALQRGVARHSLQVFDAAVLAVAFSPDGRYLAAVGNDQRVAVFDVAKEEMVFLPRGSPPRVPWVAFSHVDGSLLTMNGDGELRAFRSGSWEPRLVYRFSPQARPSLSRDGDRVAALSPDGGNIVLVTLDGHTVATVASQQSDAYIVEFFAETRVATLSPSDPDIHVYDVAVHKHLVLHGHLRWAHRLIVSPDGEKAASVGGDSAIHLWDATSGESIARFEGHQLVPYSIAFSSDGEQLASGGEDTTVRLWDIRSGGVRVLRGHSAAVAHVQFTQGGRRLLSLDAGGELRVWDARSGMLLKRLVGHTAEMTALALSPVGDLAATAGSDGRVRLWPLSEDRSRVLLGHTDWLNDAVFLDDGRHVVTAGDDGTIRRWEISGDAVDVVSQGQERVFRTYPLLGNSDQVVSYGEKSLRLWDLSALQYEILDPTQSHEFIAALSIDGRLLLAGDTAPTGDVRLFDVQGKVWSVLARYDGESIVNLRLSPDARSAIVVSGKESVVRAVDIETGVANTLGNHGGSAVTTLSISEDSRYAATGSTDGVMRLWHIDGGAAVVEFDVRSPVTAVRFLPLTARQHDARVAVSDRSGRVHVCAALDASCAVVGELGAEAQNLAVAPDGAWIAAATASLPTVLLVNIERGLSVKLRGHTQGVTQVGFSGDGTLLVSASRDMSIRLWELSDIQRWTAMSLDDVLGLSTTQLLEESKYLAQVQ